MHKLQPFKNGPVYGQSGICLVLKSVCERLLELVITDELTTVFTTVCSYISADPTLYVLMIY